MKALAIDQGTTSTRALILENNEYKIIGSINHKQYYPHQGWVEHDPIELLDNINKLINLDNSVDCIGLGNQGESCLAWQKSTLKPITPVIVWQDRRTNNFIKSLKNKDFQKTTIANAGLPLDSYFSASKLNWIISNIPEAKDLLKKDDLCLGTTDAFFLHNLTGEFVTDISTASRTSLMNLKTGSWDEELCNIFNISISCLPEIKSTMNNFGTTKNNIPITASAVDQQASLYGHGCRKVGDTKITFGTGAFALVNSGNNIPINLKDTLIPTVAWQVEGEKPIYALDGGIYCASSAINWAISLGLIANVDETNNFCYPASITKSLCFVPALVGIGSPYWNDYASGIWLGMSLNTTSHNLVQAILEGIAFRANQILIEIDNILLKTEGIKLDKVLIDGGMSNNHYFCQFLADVSQKNIVVQKNIELTALGLAYMASRQENITISKSHKIYSPQQKYKVGIKKFDIAVEIAMNWNK